MMKRITKFYAKAKQPVVLTRVFSILLTTCLGTMVALDTQANIYFFTIFGFMLGSLLVVFEYASRVIPSRKILLAVAGIILGLVTAQLLHPSVAYVGALLIHAGRWIETALFPHQSLFVSDSSSLPPAQVNPATALLISQALLGYFGLILALKHADWFRLGNLKFYLANPADRSKVLDSSALIDGRILDILKLEVIDGLIIVPEFVLSEIQALGDSKDQRKRVQGRRGLEMLDKLQATCKSLDIVDQDFPDAKDTEQKLIRLCRETGAELITSDYNLQKIAQIHQVATLNLNELADALRPTVYVGELLSLKLVKPGKERGQAIGFLEDGAMVVVDDAADYIGDFQDIFVTSILQNPTGRLIFGRRIEEEYQADSENDQSSTG